MTLSQIITFDDKGVSGHLNHIAVSMACRALPSNIDVYHLRSVPTWHKYAAILDLFNPALISGDAFSVKYINNPQGIYLVQKAMRLGHKSQMLWFRWLYILFSRYMIINELYPDERHEYFLADTYA
jgi:N-acetylglucosaminylphosphatidylinositol deacetylase